MLQLECHWYNAFGGEIFQSRYPQVDMSAYRLGVEPYLRMKFLGSRSLHTNF